MNKRNVGIALAVLFFLGGIGTWKLMGDGESAEFTKIERLQHKLINDKTISDEERDAGWKEVKQKWSSFSPEEQRKLRSQHGEKKSEGVDKYFALETEEERLAHIDQLIDEWEAEMSNKDADQKSSKKKDGDSKTKKQSAKNDGGKKKQYDHDAMREGLRNHLDGKSADERAKERIYWRTVKQRWAERHGKR